MIETRKLSNRITVVTEAASQFKTASLGIYVRTGSAFENEGNKGIAHLIEHMLFKGTKKRSAIDIAEEIVEIGDDVNAYTSKEFTAFYGTTLKELLPRLIDLFSDMLCNSAFEEKEFEKEKQIIREEIAMYEDSPEDLAHEKLQEAVWKDHPLGYIISGSEESVKSISREEALAFKQRFYTGSNIIISLAGAFENDILDRLEAAFGSLPAGKEELGLLTEPKYHNSFVCIKKRTEQLHLNLAFPCINAASDEQYAAAVFQSAFGGSNNSLLFQRIREELGLAYTVFSYNNTFCKAGILQIETTVGKKSAAATLEEILGLIEKLKKEGFTKEQVEHCKEQVIIELIMGNEGVSDKMSLNARQLICYGKIIESEEQIERLRQVTPEMVTEFADKYLLPEKSSVSLVGPVSIKQQNLIKQLIKKYS